MWTWKKLKIFRKAREETQMGWNREKNWKKQAERRRKFERYCCKQFPYLMGDMHGDASRTCMHFGISCGEGWWGIIVELASKLEPLCKEMYHNKCDENGNIVPIPRAAQIKEKFGGLRFYMTSETSEMRDLIREAEIKASKTCERCGADAAGQGGRMWIRTLCDKHLKEQEAQDRERERELELIRLKNKALSNKKYKKDS